jgi:hypothetical protein
MKIILTSLFAASLISGVATVASAQEDKTVIHKESADGEKSKTIVKHEDGSKTMVKRDGDNMKKVHTDANGDKTVVTKTTGY